MAGNLLSGDITLAPAPEEADIVIVNTCAFIKDARTESIASIKDACRLKESGPCKAVVVAGCLPQRYKESLGKDLPHVDAFVGLDDLDNITDIINRLASGQTGISRVSPSASRLFEPKMPGLVFSGGAYAYLKIAEGCNHRCSFCAIPSIRGAYRSRPISAVLAEAEKILSQGFKELAVVSQDTTAYGLDLRDGTDLPSLLRGLDGIGGKFWVRILYACPSLITDRLLETMAASPHVCRYFDIPIQHSHPQILSAMARSSTIMAMEALAGRIRKVMREATLRTTCLVGFPGETEEHFKHLLDFIERTRFDHLGVFVFSPEEGTPAALLAGRPDPSVAEQRRERLLIAQKAIVDEKAAGLSGRLAEVLLERQLDAKGACWAGRTVRQAPEVDGITRVSISSRDRRKGDFVSATYTGRDEYDMLAKETSGA